MIILLLLGQNLNEQRLIRIEDRINALETRVARIEERLNGIEKRIDDTNKRIEDLRNDLRNQMIFLGTLFVGILGVLITFLISWLNFVKDYKERKADKELVVKLEEKFKNLEDENKKLKNQNQALIFILEKFINGASKEEIKSEIEIIKKMS
ncbi:MAG: coiled-coil domain-containing protein [Candidatus Hydrothermia bacterium]|jgi:DNA anti-recombination protein RmuC